MSMGRRADPDPLDEPGAGRSGGVEAGPEPAVTGSNSDDLTVKPVLEWTDDDWARWIDSPDERRRPEVKVEAPDPGGDRPAGPVAEPEGEPEPWAPLSGEEHDLSGTDDWSLPEAVPPAEPEPAAEPESPAEPEPPAEPVSAAVEDEWAGVGDHEWWDSAPAADTSVLDLEPGPRVDGPPTPAAVPLPDPPHHADDTTGQPTPTRPKPLRAAGPTGTATRHATPPERTVPAPGRGGNVASRPGRPDPSHRVRSAFGLLGLALVVGAVMAGLLTVAVFAISVALRQAVG